jgi:polyvinyl alcohol dehydrogenase (cytochrome)
VMRKLSLFALICSTLLAQDGSAIYKDRCAKCHDTPAGRVPPVSALRAMQPSAIMDALENGPMKTQASGLTSAELQALVAYLATASKPAEASGAIGRCPGEGHSPSKPSNALNWTKWGVDEHNTRFQNSAAAGITATDVPRLRLKWAFGLGEGTAVRSQAAVAGGSVFVANLVGEVHGLDATSGCIQWTFKADAKVRTGIVFDVNNSATKVAAIYFGDERANAYAVDALTGRLLWKVHVGDHITAILTGAPQLHDSILYVPVSSFEEVVASSPAYECCSFRGSVAALDTGSGNLIWRAHAITETPQPTLKSPTGVQQRGPSGAGIWSTPTFDEKLGVLYVATGDNYSDPATAASDAIIAFDAKSGKKLWSKQVTTDDVYNNGPKANGRDFDFGQPPILVSLPNGHRELVIGQKSGIASAFDPDREGELLWQARVGTGGPLGGVQWGAAVDGDMMYVAVSDLALSGVPDKTTPQGYRLELDGKKGGGLFALRLSNGEKAWSSKPASCGERPHCSPAQSAAVTAIPGAVFSGSEDGHLRAYSSVTGEVIWDIDTAREYETVNGQTARGGSLDVAGPVIVGGILYANSGYGQWGGMPGNVLLAFSVDGR